MSSQEGRHQVKVPNTGRRGDGSRGAEDRGLNVNLSSADITGTEAGPGSGSPPLRRV